jgi:protein-L-isoaspartate(D-aspartate) O-methyltransferase
MLKQSKIKSNPDYQKLVDRLVAEGTLVTPALVKAFKKIDRSNFLTPEMDNCAGVDTALEIGCDQTISQPFTVAFMLELLQPKKDQKILDIGSGSGWQTALLAEVVGTKGKIFALEVMPELVAMGKRNVSQFGFQNIVFHNQDGSGGLVKEAPFERIIGAAAIPKIPLVLKKQLKIEGRLVIPVGTVSQEIVLVIRKGENEFQEEHFPNFVFVPMTGKYGV